MIGSRGKSLFKFCEIDIDDCANNPCFTGACRDLVQDYTCDCIPGFTGRRCEINIDECLSNPCGELGSCVDGINYFSCKCEETHYTKKIYILFK